GPSPTGPIQTKSLSHRANSDEIPVTRQASAPDFMRSYPSGHVAPLRMGAEQGRGCRGEERGDGGELVGGGPVRGVILAKIDRSVTMLTKLLDTLAACGHESILFAPRGGPDRYASTQVVGLRGYPFPLYPEVTLVPPTVDVRSALAAFDADVVHVLGPVSLG